MAKENTKTQNILNAVFKPEASNAMPLAAFDDFMKISKFFYKSIGITPYEEDTSGSKANKKSFLLDVIFYVGMFNMNLILLGELIFVLLAFKNGDNFVEATATASYIGFVSVGDFKMMYIWWKKRKLTNFMRELRNNHPDTRAKQKAYDLEKCLRNASLITFLYGLLYMILIWTYNLFTIANYWIFSRWLHLNAIEPTLPYFMYVPWNWKGNWSYYLLYFCQAMAGYTSAAGQISSDLLLCATATQVIMHYDYLARWIENYKPIAEDVNGTTETETLKEVIDYHQKLFKFSDNMNEVFGVPLLINFMISSFVICFVGFQMTIGTSGEAMFKNFLFLFSSMAQVYLICNYGQDLIDSSERIGHATYNQTWHGANAQYRKMIILIMQRAQKPSFLKATTFLKISRGSMTDLIQLSYKFFALLRTMYSR